MFKHLSTDENLFKTQKSALIQSLSPFHNLVSQGLFYCWLRSPHSEAALIYPGFRHFQAGQSTWSQWLSMGEYFTVGYMSWLWNSKHREKKRHNCLSEHISKIALWRLFIKKPIAAEMETSAPSGCRIYAFMTINWQRHGGSPVPSPSEILYKLAITGAAAS